MFAKEAMLRRAKERGGTASMIVCLVCNDAKNSDIRADHPALLKAFNERFELLESQRDELLKAPEGLMIYGSDFEHGIGPYGKAVEAIAKAKGK